jgi:transposase-like protein
MSVRSSRERLSAWEWFTVTDAARPVRHLARDRWFVDETYVKVSGQAGALRTRKSRPSAA